MNLEQLPLGASAPTIKTNHQQRPILYWYELTEKEQAEFDYLDNEEVQEWATFVRYKGNVYHMQDVMAINRRECLPLGFHKWDGYVSDSFFSGVLFKYSQDHESIICGFYYS